MSALIGWLNGVGELPENGIVLTFDDAYLSVYSEALPRLKRFGFTATLFLVTEYVGRDNQWPGQTASVPALPLMNWDQIVELGELGWEFGSHTCSHPPLTKLPAERVEEELKRSQEAIELRTGQHVRLFAQPYGATNSLVDGLVRRFFEGAASTRMGTVDLGADPFRLPRIDSFYFQPWLIPQMGRPWFRAYLEFRQGLRTVRRWLRQDWQAAG
jgi:peptidoglycan/xylan/chitin deacetylase (PgdA/CDA1 family)